MKKLMTMIAAVATAFGLFAAEMNPIVDAVDFSAEGYNFYTDTQWTYNGEAITAPTDKVWVGDDDMLHLATGSDKVQRTFVSGGAATITDAIYFDANINFEDPFDEPPVISDSDNAKVAAFVLDNSELVEEQGAAATLISTNLYVIAGYYNSETTEWEKRAFMFATPAAEGIAGKQVKRLTIKAYGDVMASSATRMGFRFFLNGDTEIKNALAVDAVFKINDDGSINFTDDVIYAEDSATPYLGDGVIDMLEPAVRARGKHTDRSLVLGLTDAANALNGFDLAGKGKLAKFTLTTASPAFIDGDSQTVTLNLVNTTVDVEGAIDFDQNSITFAKGETISVTATYDEGKSDIVKWTKNGTPITPTDDTYSWAPNNNDILAISAKAAGAFVIASDGTKIPFENLFGSEPTTDAEAYVRANGGTLQLVDDAEYPDGNYFVVSEGEDFTLDLAGYDFVGSSDTYASILIQAGKLTITNSTVAVGTISASVQDGLAIENNATLVIAGGIMADTVATQKYADDDEPNTTITGGAFDGEVTVGTGAELETTGGFFNKDVFVEATDVPGVPEEGYKVVDGPEGYWKVVPVTGYIATFMNGTEVWDTQTDVTEAQEPETDPTKENYTFKGWALEGTTDIVEFPYAISADTTFDAVFAENAYLTIKDIEGKFYDYESAAAAVAALTEIEVTVHGMMAGGDIKLGKSADKVTVRAATEKVDGFNTAVTMGAGIKVYGIKFDQVGTLQSNGYFENCLFYDVTSDMPAGVVCKGCDFIAAPETAKNYPLQNCGGAVRFEDCLFQGYIRGANVSVSLTGDNTKKAEITFKGCTFKGMKSIDQGAVQVALKDGSRLYIEGCSFVDCAGSAICLHDTLVSTSTTLINSTDFTGATYLINDHLAETSANPGFYWGNGNNTNGVEQAAMDKGSKDDPKYAYPTHISYEINLPTGITYADWDGAKFKLPADDTTQYTLADIEAMARCTAFLVKPGYAAPAAARTYTVEAAEVANCDFAYQLVAKTATEVTFTATGATYTITSEETAPFYAGDVVTFTVALDQAATGYTLPITVTGATATETENEYTFTVGTEPITVAITATAAAQPVVPGEDIKTDKTPAEINESLELKKKLLTPPGDAEVGDDYYGYFDAVNGSESGTVKFVLNEDGSNTVATAEAAANADALEEVLAATGDSATLSIETPVAGFYYSLKQSGVVTTLGFNVPGDANKLATGKNTITFELVKPENAGFYQTIVTPVPVETNRADN